MKKFSKINESIKEQLDDYCIEITDALGIDPIITDKKTPRYEIFYFVWNLKINTNSITNNSKDFQNYLNALQEIPVLYNRVKLKHIEVKLLSSSIQVIFKREINADKQKRDFISHVEDLVIFLDYSEISSWFKQNGYDPTGYELPDEDTGSFINFEEDLSDDVLKKFRSEFNEELSKKRHSGMIEPVIFIRNYSIDSTNTLYFYTRSGEFALSIIE